MKNIWGYFDFLKDHAVPIGLWVCGFCFLWYCGQTYCERKMAKKNHALTKYLNSQKELNELYASKTQKVFFCDQDFIGTYLSHVYRYLELIQIWPKKRESVTLDEMLLTLLELQKHNPDNHFINDLTETVWDKVNITKIIRRATKQKNVFEKMYDKIERARM